MDINNPEIPFDKSREMALYEKARLAIESPFKCNVDVGDDGTRSYHKFKVHDGGQKVCIGMSFLTGDRLQPSMITTEWVTETFKCYKFFNRTQRSPKGSNRVVAPQRKKKADADNIADWLALARSQLFKVLKKYFEDAWEHRVCENANLFAVEHGTLTCKPKENVRNVYFDIKEDVSFGGVMWLEFSAASRYIQVV